MRIVKLHTPRFTAQAQQLVDAALGEGYTHRRDLKKLMEGPWAVGLATSSDRLVGVAIGYRESADYTPWLAKMPDQGNQIGQTAIIKTLVVDPDSRRKGYGRLLVQELLLRIQHDNIRAVFALCWLSGDADQSAPVFAAAGFTPVMTLERWWYSDSVASQWDCPSCGNPCICSALIMTRRLDS